MACEYQIHMGTASLKILNNGSIIFPFSYWQNAKVKLLLVTFYDPKTILELIIIFESRFLQTVTGWIPSGVDFFDFEWAYAILTRN